MGTLNMVAGNYFVKCWWQEFLGETASQGEDAY